MVHLHELSVTDQPREKLLQHGASYLTDIELLAILIGFGTKELPVLALCEKVFGEFDNDLDLLAAANMAALCQIKGISSAKGAIILAAMELGKRRIALQRQTPKIKSDDDAVKIVAPYFKGVITPLFMLVLLDRNYNLLAVSELLLTNGLPDITSLMQIVVESGAQRFGLVRNNVGMFDGEAQLLADLDAAANMLGLQFHGRVIINSA